MGLYVQVGNRALVAGAGNNTTITTSAQAKMLLILGSKQTATGQVADASLDMGFSLGDGVKDGTSSVFQGDGLATGTETNSLFAGFGHTSQLHVWEQVTTGQQTNFQYTSATLGTTSFT